MKIFTRILSLLLALMLLASLPLAVYADEQEAMETEESGSSDGTCGDGLTWELSGGTLTVTGSGDMTSTPWEGRKRSIQTVILSGGVTSVAADAFSGCENLTSVDFGDSLKQIHDRAFRDCLGLTSISLPATFKLFGPESFYGCANLESVHCAGGMPSFKGNSLWTGSFVTIYHPVNNPWPQESVEILLSNFGGHLSVMAGGEHAIVLAEEKTPVETVMATEAAEIIEAPTMPPMPEPVETTVPVTEEAVPAETTEAVVYTLPTMATEPIEEPAEKDGKGLIIGVILVGGVLTFFLVGMLIFRSVSNKGGKYYQ